MTASRSARERKASAQAGSLWLVKIELDDRQEFVYKIKCTECVVRGQVSWSAYRPGGDNGFMAAMDRWILHLDAKHPGATAPCLMFLPEAEQRLHAHRQQRRSDPADRDP